MSDFVLNLCYELALSAPCVLSVPFAINKLRVINRSVGPIPIARSKRNRAQRSCHPPFCPTFFVPSSIPFSITKQANQEKVESFEIFTREILRLTKLTS